MRRYGLYLFLILLFSLLALTAVAQDRPPAEADVVVPPPQMIAATEWQPEALAPIQWGRLPDTPLAVTDASDTCSAATVLDLPGGDSTVINSATSSPDDPVLTFAWGPLSNPGGYRTVWYKFTAPSNGRVTVETLLSDYDTLLAVYTGDCTNLPASLKALAVDDDTQLFSSEVVFPVAQNETYYIEVADYQSFASGALTLRLSAWIDPVDSLWVKENNLLLARSRHALAAVDKYFYVLGGQTNILGTAEIINSLDQFNTETGEWIGMTQMPGAGYSNTDMVYLKTANDNGRLYTPSGYDGNDQQFNGTHYVYDVSTNAWLTRATAPWPNGIPLAWTATVAQPSPAGYYVIGGITAQPTFQNDVVSDGVYFYNVASDVWLLRSSLSAPRYAHTGDWVGGRACVAGGISTGNVLMPNGECYNPASGTWVVTNDMSYPRYNAGSAVGPDGKWYVFGGIDGNGIAVAVTEVYNPATNSWSVLGPQYWLGGLNNLPARAWPRGEFIDDKLWVLGGNNMPDRQVLPLVETLQLKPNNLYIPAVPQAYYGWMSPDETFAEARPLTFGVRQYHAFVGIRDYYDIFRFEITAHKIVNTRLDDVPSDSNYDLYVYDSKKVLQGTGSNVQLGHREEFSLDIAAGTYYVVVHRAYPAGFPNTANYSLLVREYDPGAKEE